MPAGADLNISLMWPDSESFSHWNDKSYPLRNELIADLRLDKICRQIEINDNYSMLLMHLSCVDDNQKSVKYRNDFLKDIIKHEWLRDVLLQIKNIIKLIEKENSMLINKSIPVNEALWAIQKTCDVYKLCDKIYNSIENHDIDYMNNNYSEVVCKLHKLADKILYQDDNKSLRNDIYDILDKLTGLQHVKITYDVKKGKGHFSIIDEQKDSLFSKIIGYKSENVFKNKQIKRETYTFPLFDGILHVLSKEYPSIFKSVIDLGNRVKSLGYIYKTLINFKSEIDYYESALLLKKILEDSNLPCCIPEIAEKQCNGIVVLNEFYDPVMALMMKEAHSTRDIKIVSNNICFTGDEQIYIITGPNQGGKTTWLRGLALCQILFQAGMFVPASYARLNVKDRIFTHFPADEKNIINKGRLAEEADRLKIIFANITDNSLVMLNEPFASTNFIDATDILSGVLKALKKNGAAAALVTHLHELLDYADKINEVSGGSKLVHLTACTESDLIGNTCNSSMRTYKILPDIKKSGSYAIDIALKFGADPETLNKVICYKLAL